MDATDQQTVTVGERIPLYDGPAPGSEQWTHVEQQYYSDRWATEVVANVVAPSLTPVLPQTCCGTAVVVAPGGGYHALSIVSEGHAVADYLAGRGIAAFVLRYRLVPTGDDAPAELEQRMMLGLGDDAMEPIAPLAAADAAAALRFVRSHAASYGVAPDRVGMIGFSAGGNVALHCAYAADPADRPDFVAPIYAPKRFVTLDRPPQPCVPMFIAAASDDPLGLALDSVELYSAWVAAGGSAELHLYAAGGHGFGMRRQGLPSDTWIRRYDEWLVAQGLLDG